MAEEKEEEVLPGHVVCRVPPLENKRSISLVQKLLTRAAAEELCASARTGGAECLLPLSVTPLLLPCLGRPQLPAPGERGAVGGTRLHANVGTRSKKFHFSKEEVFPLEAKASGAWREAEGVGARALGLGAEGKLNQKLERVSFYTLRATLQPSATIARDHMTQSPMTSPAPTRVHPEPTALDPKS